MDSGENIDPTDWRTLEPHFAALLRQELGPGHVPAWLARWSELQKVVLEQNVVLLRERAKDLTVEEHQAAYRRFTSDVLSPFALANQALRAKALGVADWQPGPEYRQFIRQWRNQADLFREENVPLTAAINAAASAYERALAAMRVVLDGREVSGAELQRLLRDPNRDRREATWRARSSPWQQARATLDALFLDLLAKRRLLARNAGQSDYRAYAWRALGRLDYTPADALRFHDAVATEFVPLAARRHEARRAKLGVGTLRPWDQWVTPDARPPLHPFADVAAFEEAMAGVFSRANPELGALYGRMRDGFLDLGWRRGKQSGGQVMVFPLSRLPHVIVGADGTNVGVDLLLHEMGHAYHYALVMQPGFLVWEWDFPDEFAEFAATALTHLVRPFLSRERGGFYHEEEARRARAWYLDELVVNGLPAFSLADSFQHWVYAEAPEHVSPGDLDAKWVELAARFAPWLDWSGLEANRAAGWQRELFPFVRPFYDITYELAHLGALQVWQQAQTDEVAAWRNYRAALALGNTRPLPALYAATGASPPFDPITVQEAARFVADQLADAD